MLQMLCFYSALGIHLVRDISYTSHNQCVYMQSFSDKETNKTSTGLLKCEWILALTLSPDWNATWRRKGLLPYAGQLSVHFGSMSFLRRSIEVNWQLSVLKTSFSNAACACCCWGVEVNWKWLSNHLLKGLQHHLGSGFSHAPAIIRSKGHVRSDNLHGPNE